MDIPLKIVFAEPRVIFVPGGRKVITPYRILINLNRIPLHTIAGDTILGIQLSALGNDDLTHPDCPECRQMKCARCDTPLYGSLDDGLCPACAHYKQCFYCDTWVAEEDIAPDDLCKSCYDHFNPLVNCFINDCGRLMRMSELNDDGLCPDCATLPACTGCGHRGDMTGDAVRHAGEKMTCSTLTTPTTSHTTVPRPYHHCATWGCICSGAYANSWRDRTLPPRKGHYGLRGAAAPTI